MKASARLIASFSLCAAATTLAIALASRNVAAAGNPSANLDQCANGTIMTPVPCAGSGWQNGNTNANNSHWYEGDSIAYRMRFSNLAPGSTHTVTIEWDTTKSADHALDYLTSYDRSEKVGRECASRLRRDVLDRLHGHDCAGRHQDLHGDQRRPGAAPHHQQGGGQRQRRQSDRGFVLGHHWRNGRSRGRQHVAGPVDGPNADQRRQL